MTPETEAKTKWVDYAESWYKTWCPFCDTMNWHCNGNESNITGLDVEAIECWSCQSVYRLGEYDPIAEEIRGDGMIVEEKGIKTPTE